MLIKICGITCANTAKLTALNGADYIGLLFSAVSPRMITLDQATPITLAARSGGAEVVGVFVDESLELMQNIILHLNLRIIQLHGAAVKKLCHLIDPNIQIIYVVDDQPLPDHLNPKRDFLLFENKPPRATEFRYFIAGGLDSTNVIDRIKTDHPDGIDLSRGVESKIAIKDIDKISSLIRTVRPQRFGHFGGQYVPELLMTPLLELENVFDTIVKTSAFDTELLQILHNYAGRPTALTEAKNFATHIGGDCRIFLKREDLLHTGAHKINNALGQCLLARKMGKNRIIAETGAGQHGLATATACALMGLQCVIYMGQVDIERQEPNVVKMRLLGATVMSVTSGSATLKDAVNEALRDWAESYETTHYCLGSALGPHPFPTLVAHFQSIIGREAKAQFFTRVGSHPDVVIACVGGGSNAIGIFSDYLNSPQVTLIGVEAGGSGVGLGNHAARFMDGTPGVFHGNYTYLLQTPDGQISTTNSISAGLDYCAVGPQHAYLFATNRVQYKIATDQEALNAFLILSKTEGIIPALESSHALGYVLQHVNDFKRGSNILINLSGRGDKDLPQLLSKNLL